MKILLYNIFLGALQKCSAVPLFSSRDGEFLYKPCQNLLSYENLDFRVRGNDASATSSVMPAQAGI